ncbi:MAG: hypothetical protein AB1428_11530 [Bacteroidota bacterium]
MSRTIRIRALFPLLAATIALHAGAQPRYEHALSASGGLYAASGLGTNFYYGARYNYFIFGGRYFVEASIGSGSLKSRVLESVSKAQIFSTDRLLTYEFSVAYDAMPTGALPFVLFGVAGINQGGETSFAGVIGFGKRVPIPGLFGSNGLGVRFDARDHIFSQRINNSDPAITHNIVATLGVQVYF